MGVSYELLCKMISLFGPLKMVLGVKREDLTRWTNRLKHVFGCTERKSTLIRVSCGRVEGTKNNEKSAQRDANTARCLCRRGPSSISVPLPDLKQIAVFIQELFGGQKFRNRVTWPRPRPFRVVLYALRTRGPSCISVPNLRRIAQFVQVII